MKYSFTVVLLIFFLNLTKAQWVEQNSKVTNNLTDVHFATPQVGYVTSGANFILKTLNGGISWDTIGNNNEAITCWFTSIDTGYLGNDTKIKKTTDGGQTNTFLYNPPFDQVRDIFFLNSTIGFMVGCRSCNTGWAVAPGIYKTNNAGASWSSLYPSGGGPPLFGVSFTSPDTGYVVGGSSLIMKTINGGTSWTPLSSPVSGGNTNFRSVSFIPQSTIGYIVGGNYTTNMGIIIKTTDGTNWINVSPSSSPPFNSVSFIDTDNGIAVGDNGVIYRTTDSGLNWILETSSVTSSLRSIFFIDTNNAWAVGDGGKIITINSNLVGIKEKKSEDGIIIYPNPSKGIFTFIPDNEINYEIEIFNLVGKPIYKSLTNNKTIINLSSEPKGFYFIHITDENNIVFSKKIVIQ